MFNVTKYRVESEAEYKGKVYFDKYYKRERVITLGLKNGM